MPELHSDKLQFLEEHFRVTNRPSNDLLASCHAKDLVDPEKCHHYLTCLSDRLGSPSLLVTASQFSKRYTFLAVLPVLYAMSVYNKGLDVSVENCYVESAYQKENWLPKLRLDSWVTTEPGLNRSRWRKEIVKSIFADHISGVWQVLSKCAGISCSILWENTAIYVYWLYEKKLADAPEAIRTRVKEDFQFLIRHAPADCFGGCTQPLAKYYSETNMTDRSDPPVRIRKTCCLYYHLNAAGKCCSGCPRSLRTECGAACATLVTN
ncbi:IucA/IucC family C-terminal-domain containing protein [Paenactinomyces guangxiensis]|uniref:(2Fe-2S)-binding protein n=1 Tax=Paenactinomyces guangxiensis TaxID=1490290 RepID=A0A7W1WRQ0_9BACL|nr:IucA/IucC family C-terminal-domain containing protein [Paenactinomyces guangxiensis]MBA4494729.1 (2Fe-2S)-binding protein [Paenactinomyces guangxiensis]MBH8591813.1 (2Fe-2S)-binding protein [Paenactinomyces guangxiensis]